MWPFTKKTAEERVDTSRIGEDLLRAFRKPGETFNYLGATMLVCAVKAKYRGMGYFQSVMECNYRDGDGKIQLLYFEVSDLSGMIAQNPSPDAALGSHQGEKNG